MKKSISGLLKRIEEFVEPTFVVTPNNADAADWYAKMKPERQSFPARRAWWPSLSLWSLPERRKKEKATKIIFVHLQHFEAGFRYAIA